MIDEATFKSPIIPAGDKIIAVRLQEKKQVGSLFIPDQSVEKPAVGILLAKGPKVEEDFKPLSFIVFGRYAGYEQPIDGVVYLILHEEEILGVLDEKMALKEYDVQLV